jgi:hypothetical protein
LAYESSDLRRSYLVEYVVHEAMLEGRADASVESAFAWGVGALRREHPDRMPVQFDEVPGELSLGTAAPLPAPGQGTPPTPSTTTSTTRPPPSKGPPPEPNRSCILTVGSTVRCPND